MPKLKVELARDLLGEVGNAHRTCHHLGGALVVRKDQTRCLVPPCSELLAALFARARSLHFPPKFPDKFRPIRRPSASNLL